NAAAHSIAGPETSDKIVVAYPGVDSQRFNNGPDQNLRRALTPDNDVLIAHVARIHYWKGQDYFLDALCKLKNRGVTGFRAVIVGEVYHGYEPLRAQLEQKIKNLNLCNEVRLLGHREDTDAIFQSVDIAVSPSTLPEPFGLVVAEAMAARRPVIATAAGGPSEMIEDGVSGFLIPIDNADVFADRLEKLIR